jgi:hypothetical protein
MLSLSDVVQRGLGVGCGLMDSRRVVGMWMERWGDLWSFAHKVLSLDITGESTMVVAVAQGLV